MLADVSKVIVAEWAECCPSGDRLKRAGIIMTAPAAAGATGC